MTTAELDRPMAPPAGPVGPGRALAALDHADIAYCLPHGHSAGSDLDLVVPTDVRPSRVAAALNGTAGTVVRCLSGHVVLADVSGSFLDLDVTSAYGVCGRHFYSASELLAGRRRRDGLWVPPGPIEFGCRLVRRMAKADLADADGEALTTLYRDDPAACREQVIRFWRPASAAVIAAAAESGDWTAVRRDLVRAGLRWPAPGEGRASHRHARRTGPRDRPRRVSERAARAEARGSFGRRASTSRARRSARAQRPR